MRGNNGLGLSVINRGMHNPLGANPLPKNLGPPPRTCQWIEGEPREREFCCKPVTKMLNGEPSSYCEKHYNQAYVPPDKGLERLARIGTLDTFGQHKTANDIDKKSWQSIIKDHETLAHKSREP
jgi:hypothetical protein